MKIHEAPTYATLKDIKDQIKANAASVICGLYRGVNCHLGLVLLTVEYANVTIVLYKRPDHPGALVIHLETPNMQLQEHVKIINKIFNFL